MALSGLDPITGEKILLKTHSGDGKEGTEFVLERADPIAHSKLDSVKSAVDGLFTAPLVHTYNRSAAAAIVKTATAKLRGFYIFNTSDTNDIHLLFFNLNNVPANGAANFSICPFSVFPREKFGMGSEMFSEEGLDFSNGIAYGLSSSDTQYLPISDPASVIMTIFYR